MRSMRRAEALAAVAMVVSAGHEPSTALQRMAEQDPALRRLARVSRACAAGEALPDALCRAGLISRRQRGTLAGLAPAVLADELTRCARRGMEPLAAETLARSYPVFLLAAAFLPYCLLNAIVITVTGETFRGLWVVLGLANPSAASFGRWGFAAIALAALALTAVGWRMLRLIPVARQATYVDRGLEHRRLTLDLLIAARAGQASAAMYRHWSSLGGSHRALLAELDIAGGDVTTALIALALVPRRADGAPDWESAILEAEVRRACYASTALPWLVMPIAVAFVLGLCYVNEFVSWF